VESVLDHIHSYFKLNPSTLSGAVDIIVVKQKDGKMKSSPFHVRFGKLKLLSYKENKITLTVNGEESPVKMKMGSGGIVSFVHLSQERVPMLSTSPIPLSPIQSDNEEDELLQNENNEINNTNETNETNFFLEEPMNIIKEHSGESNENVDNDNIEISKCGQEIFDPNISPEQVEMMFKKNLLDYESLIDQFKYHEILPLISTELIFKIDGKYYPWKVAAPMIMSQLIYKRSLSKHIFDKLVEETTDKSQPSSNNEKSWSDWFWRKGKKKKKKYSKRNFFITRKG